MNALAAATTVAAAPVLIRPESTLSARNYLDLPGEVGEPVLTDDQRRALEPVGLDAELLDAGRVLLARGGERLDPVDDRRRAAFGLRRQHAE